MSPSLKSKPLIKKQTGNDQCYSQNLRILHSTVSRAMRNKPEVKFETRQLVQEMMKNLNYLPILRHSRKEKKKKSTKKY